MSRLSMRMPAAAILAIAIAGCGTGSQIGTTSTPGAAAGAVPRSHPQVIEPSAGVEVSATGPVDVVVGDIRAHAPPLAEIKHELAMLNLCGGVTNSADAAPVATSSGPGFVADPGTSQTEGELPELTARLNALGKALGVTIYGISGYRTPAHSVAVGGYADDPHTKGLAEDIGVNSLLRSSAAQISEAELARFGLYRPFDPSDDPNNTEVNHIQMLPSAGAVSPAQSARTWNQDPMCR